MSYFAYDRMGVAVQSPTDAQMWELLRSLVAADPEHPDVSLTHESGWSLSAYHGGLVVFENVETGEGPWHIRLAPTDQILEFWRTLSIGDHEALLSLPWADGYGA